MFKDRLSDVRLFLASFIIVILLLTEHVSLFSDYCQYNLCASPHDDGMWGAAADADDKFLRNWILFSVFGNSTEMLGLR